RELHETEPIALRVEPHRLGVDRVHGAERQPARQVVPVELDLRGGKAHLRRGREAGPGNGAQEKTRTSTASRPQVPETCASTNSATWARKKPPCLWSALPSPPLTRCQSAFPRRGCERREVALRREHACEGRRERIRSGELGGARWQIGA